MIFIFLLLVFWYWFCCIFYSNMFFFYVLIIQKKKFLKAAVCFHFMKFCHSVECCQVFQTSISSFLCFCYSVASNQGFSSNNMFLFYVFDLQHNFLWVNTILCVFAIQENDRKFFFVFLAFIKMFSDIKMKSIFASSNVFLSFVFVI